MMRALLVEDYAPMRDILAQRLAGRGFAVLAFGTLAEALGAVEQDLDLLVLDLRLPDGNGHDLARKLAREDVPVVAVTGFPADADELTDVALLEVLTKPFEISDFDTAVDRACADRERIHSMRDSATRMQKFISKSLILTVALLSSLATRFDKDRSRITASAELATYLSRT
jgi:DNA-binding response OmpR family regulator